MRSLRLLFFLCLFSFSGILKAQELNCSVDVISIQIANVDKKLFESLKTSVFEFMNNTKWTSDVFKNEEKIECSIIINVKEQVSTNEFRGSIQIQSRRPVYKSSYNSVLMNYQDQDFSFKYLEMQQMQFSDNTFTDNLTSVLAFYAYMILGFDYDSFSPDGGKPYFQKAQNIVTIAQNGPDVGWKPYENSKNRYWFVENVLNTNFAPFIKMVYEYHRIGLDNMHLDPETSRDKIFAAIETLQNISNVSPNTYILLIFFNAKADEIVNIFSGATPELKGKVVPVLNLLDPANSTKYQKITSSK